MVRVTKQSCKKVLLLVLGKFMDIQQLSQQFADHSDVRFRQQGDGLIMIDIDNSLAQATICLQGAQLIEWTPVNAEPVIWLSEQTIYSSGKAIRGGIPVCWPWFGAHPDNAALPAHGFARVLPWTLESVDTPDDGASCLLFILETCEQSRALWPYEFELRLTITVGTTLDMTLKTINRDRQAVTISEALHTYFKVSDVRTILISGLDQTAYLDKPDGFREKQQAGNIQINEEVDRVYIDTAVDCIIEDPGLHRNIVISKSGSQSTVVWNPWLEKSAAMSDMGEQAYRHMLCVESANAASNRIELQPGDSHSLQVNYRVMDL